MPPLEAPPFQVVVKFGRPRDDLSRRDACFELPRPGQSEPCTHREFTLRRWQKAKAGAQKNGWCRLRGRDTDLEHWCQGTEPAETADHVCDDRRIQIAGIGI